MKIGIIGGGITGLTTAIALQKSGIESVVVFEQAKEMSEVGAGIWIQPNAIKILDGLGLKKEIQEQGIELAKMEITNSELKPFKKIKSEIVEDEFGNRTIAIHRARLQKILFQELQKSNNVRLNKKYVHHTEVNNSLKLEFENDQEFVDILLAADGINSAVRKNIFPSSRTRNSGQVCWRGISNINLPDLLKSLGKEAWGNKIRFGFSQIFEDEVYWFAVANHEHLEIAKEMNQKEYLRSLFRDFHPVIGEIIANTESDKIHQTILQDLVRLPAWSENNVCLLGDAAHAMTPNMGQGACQGIEDAHYMSRYLAEFLSNAPEAFQKFQQKRREKVDSIVNNSWQFGKLAHSSFGQPLLKLMLKITPEHVLKSQMKKLFTVDELVSH